MCCASWLCVLCHVPGGICIISFGLASLGHLAFTPSSLSLFSCVISAHPSPSASLPHIIGGHVVDGCTYPLGNLVPVGSLLRVKGHALSAAGLRGVFRCDIDETVWEGPLRLERPRSIPASKPPGSAQPSGSSAAARRAVRRRALARWSSTSCFSKAALAGSLDEGACDAIPEESQHAPLLLAAEAC